LNCLLKARLVQNSATGFRQELIERKAFRIDLVSSNVNPQNTSSAILNKEFSKFMLKNKKNSEK
jgi:hypothetical protein